MHEFLDQIYFDNTLREYTIALAIILLGFLFKRFIARYIALFISYLIIKRYKDINKTAFRDQVARPLGFFIIVFIIVVALDKLNFPHKLDITIYHLNLKELFRMVSSAILIISFFRFLIKCIDFATLLIKERYLNDEEHGKHQLVYFFKDVIKVLIGLVGLLLILKYTFNYDIKGLVTGLSIVGAAVALALKESLENFIASFVIFFDKPFGTGDSVKINGVSGTIENIGLRSTRIRTEAKTYVTVPNKQMVDSIVDNLSNRTQYRGDFRLEIVPDTAPPKNRSPHFRHQKTHDGSGYPKLPCLPEQSGTQCHHHYIRLLYGSSKCRFLQCHQTKTKSGYSITDERSGYCHGRHLHYH